ncbi:MAG: hypothetical protein U0T36_03580 [Saprospiraceae bacterium]|jgi:hypothetical protein
MKTNIYKSFNWLAVILLTLTSSFVQAKAKSNAWPFTLNCPANAYVSCTDELWNLSAYGNATYSIGPYTYTAGNPSVQYNLNSCNAGTITRTWMVEDQYWNWHTCTQTIYVSSTSNGGPVIDWPEDIELNGCNPNTNPYQLPEPNNYPTWQDSECSMLGKSYSDMLFTVNSQCKKIMRTWKVLDWCNYSPTNGYGIYTKVQVIYIINNAPPVFACPGDFTVNSFNCKDAEVIATPFNIDPSTCGGNFEITNNSPYARAKGKDISGKYPVGTHKVTYTIKYGCGKTKTCTTNVIVKNAAKPTPYCIAQLVTTLMPLDTDNDGKTDNGMVELWAKDLNKGSFSSCGFQPLKFSFSKDVNETSKTFTCDNIGSNMVQMWVTDSKGGQEYCLVEVIIQNNGANIPDCHPKPVAPVDPIYSQKGNVLTLTDTPLKDATMTLQYKEPIIKYTSTYDTTETLELDSFINLSGYKLYRYITVLKITETKDSTVEYISKTVNTNADGKYLFDSLLVHDQKIEISGTYSDDKHKNIDNKDVELLTKFLLGDVTFTSYHQYLASDINEDGIVDINDQNILMEFVTGTRANLPGKFQWYLLDKKATYTKPEDVLKQALPLVVTLDSLAEINPVVDFIAIKKGNISIDPGSLQDAEVNSRNRVASNHVISVSPNPFVDEVTFSIHVESAAASVLTFYNATGQLVKSENLTLQKGHNSFKIKLAHHQTGIMYYSLNIGYQTHSGTIVRAQ